MGARAGLRVVLHREGGFAFYLDALNRVVVEVDMRGFDETGRIVHGLFEHTETVVLARDLTKACTQIFYRMVDAPMTVVQFIGGQTDGAC